MLFRFKQICRYAAESHGNDSFVTNSSDTTELNATTSVVTNSSSCHLVVCQYCNKSSLFVTDPSVGHQSWMLSIRLRRLSNDNDCATGRVCYPRQFKHRV